MTYKRFEGCCAATELYVVSYSEKVIKDTLREIARGVEGRNPNGRKGGYHMVVATLNDSQLRQREALLESGFDVLSTYKNGITGHTVTLYGTYVKITKGD